MEDLDQLLADLQSVSQRARNAYENSQTETRLEPMVLNRSLPAQRNQILNLIRPDSIIDPEPSPKSLNELNQLLDALSKARETMKSDSQIVRTSHEPNSTPTKVIHITEDSSIKSTKSINDAIDTLNETTETIKSSSRKKSSSSKNSSRKPATKELEDLMESLSSFKLPTQISSTSCLPSDLTSAVEQIPSLKTTSIPQQYPLCHSCQKPIVGQIITVLDRSYHPEHLRCTACNTEIGRKDFYEKSGKPYCELDYRRLFAPKCARCDQPIVDVMITALNRNWHPEHFLCELCERRVGEDGYHEKDGYAYCRECYMTNFVPKCLGCKQVIIDTYIQALGGHYHKNCFVCKECSQPFLTGSFYEHEHQPLCELHYHQRRGSLCSSCQKPIGGRCITAMGRKYHVEHFICSYCTRQLQNGTFKEFQNKPYCHPCFVKLFA
ncbi:unnamed protein product [Rotaria magnacalcarata]|uniref:LIM zinc-binding domain-containing protein n=1 Tax=Rotaria magnacalcarata TaxID=392030 RepID=A0A819L2A5_9BILA|nr:unnamed protein product [Rotaria magnacalcarata]CAF3956872.1 unnamed protein product [Rotaria magnacalcarata]CAF3958538.1 unnamed protein product [Rotaria magnacalcarata]CAF4016299.1 unnamed protein product [Rotaria magnacalcarata]CAF4332255.1 unnamed protein product [Rotaria magnacalcarata]